MDDDISLDEELEVEASGYSEELKQRLAALEAELITMSDEQIARLLLNKMLKSLAIRIEEGMATAADLNVARAILKDNDIGIIPTRDNAAGKLKEKLERRASESKAMPMDEICTLDISDWTNQ